MGIIGALFTLALVQKETESVIAVAVVVSALLAALLGATCSPACKRTGASGCRGTT